MTFDSAIQGVVHYRKTNMISESLLFRMATINVICPYNGCETKAPIPRDAKLAAVRQSGTTGDGWSTVSCSECGAEFRVSYIRE